MRLKHAVLVALCAVLASPAAAQSLAPPGAAACSGCHAPPRLASAVPPIHGRPAQDTVQAMAEFRSGQRQATVMNRIAKGFTEAETEAIAAWLATPATRAPSICGCTCSRAPRSQRRRCRKQIGSSP